MSTVLLVVVAIWLPPMAYFSISYGNSLARSNYLAYPARDRRAYTGALTGLLFGLVVGLFAGIVGAPGFYLDLIRGARKRFRPSKPA